jgi:hypothetical protein
LLNPQAAKHTADVAVEHSLRSKKRWQRGRLFPTPCSPQNHKMIHDPRMFGHAAKALRAMEDSTSGPGAVVWHPALGWQP